MAIFRHRGPGSVSRLEQLWARSRAIRHQVCLGHFSQKEAAMGQHAFASTCRSLIPDENRDACFCTEKATKKKQDVVVNI